MNGSPVLGFVGKTVFEHDEATGGLSAGEWMG
jgi:hypothetical protein